MHEILTALLARAGVDWIEAKAFIERASGVSHDAMHVMLGLIAQIALAGLLRSSVARGLPWAVVLLFELANEWNDLRIESWPSPGEQLGEGFKDVMLTMAMPTLLLVLARWWPAVLRRPD